MHHTLPRKTLAVLFLFLITINSSAQVRSATITDIVKDGVLVTGAIEKTGFFAWYAAQGIGIDHTLNFYDAELSLVNSIKIAGDYNLENYDEKDNLLCICLKKPLLVNSNSVLYVYNGQGIQQGTLTLEKQILTSLILTDNGIFIQSYDTKTNIEYQCLYDEKLKEKWKLEETKTATQYYMHAETYPFIEADEWLFGINQYEREKGLKYHYLLKIKSINPATGAKNFEYTENTANSYFVPQSIKKTADGNYDVLGSYRVYKFPNTITPDESGIFKLTLNSTGEKMTMIQTKWSQFLSKVYAVSKHPDAGEIKNIYKKTIYGNTTSASPYFPGTTITSVMVWDHQYGFFAFAGSEFFMIYTDEDLRVSSVKNIRSNKNDPGKQLLGFFTCGEDPYLPDQISYLALVDDHHVRMFFVDPSPDNFTTSSFDKLTFEDKFDKIVYNSSTGLTNIDIIPTDDCGRFVFTNIQVAASKDARIYLYVR
jgi:hypothetical protein